MSRGDLRKIVESYRMQNGSQLAISTSLHHVEQAMDNLEMLKYEDDPRLAEAHEHIFNAYQAMRAFVENRE